MALKITPHQPLDRSYLESVLPVPCRSRDDSLSDKYVQFSTLDVIDALAPEGFVPVAARAQGCRGETNPLFQVHEVRLAHRDYMTALEIQDAGTFTSTGIPEIVIVNSHNGERALSLEMAVYRQVCSNGMVLPDKGTFEGYRHKHIGISPEDILDWCIKAAGGFVPLMEAIRKFERLQLSDGEEAAFAFKAAKLLTEHGRPEVEDYHQLLTPHRYHDGERHDLWTTFNKVQENAARGSRDIRVKSNGTGRRRNQSLRGCGSILRGNAFDKDLWSLMEEFAADTIAAADGVFEEVGTSNL